MGFKLLVTGILLLFSSSLWAKPLPVNTRLGGDFSLPSTLADTEGNPGKVANLSDFRGKVVLLNFGYTSCPDICPMVVARMTQVVKRLG
ncbi:MAG: SCO family protein, partial [Ketobacteraceae bacterium]|nr:SCO family protein [Ketobacteraceae bacterium]